MGYNRVLGHFTNSQELAVPWQTGQLYLVNQIVINTNLLYLCATQHTSGATFAADLALGYWVGINNGAITTIAQGGTGQTTQTAAFDALSPTTTAGDLIVYNGTDNVRQAVGSDGQVLIADSSQPNKLKWATAPSGNTNFITNGSAESNNTTGWATYAESDAVTFTNAGDVVSTASAHGLSNGNQISFTSISGANGLTANILYYVISATSTTFQVATSLGGTAVVITADTTGTMVRFAPKTGSGGVANVGISANGTNPLIGSYSFLLAKGAPNREGEGWSYDFTIDRGYQAKVLQISFNYIIAAANTFVAGTSTTVSDVTVWIYDVTNAVVIQPSSFKLLSNNASISDTFNATFQTASNSTSYRLIFHVSTPSTTDYTLKVDGISVSPSTYVYGTPVTDWQAYTPTFQGFGTPTSVQFQWRRVGADLEVRGRFNPGTSTAVEARVSFPSGLTSADTSLIPALQIAGMAASNATAANSRTVLIEPSVTYFTFGVTTNGPLTRNNGNVVATSPEVFAFFAKVAIQGWSSSVQTSDQTDTRVVAAAANTLSSTTLPANAALLFNTTTIDTHGAITIGAGYKYTVPVSGNYRISCSFPPITAGSGSLYVAKNGSFTFTAQNFITSASTAHGGGGSIVLPLVAGDTIQFSFNSAATASSVNANFSIERLSGPSAIAASETVACRYTNTAGSSYGTSDSLMPFATKDYDTHNAWVTNTFTAPISGKYLANIILTSASTGIVLNAVLYKNGASFCQVGAGYSTGSTRSVGSATVSLNAGDTLSFYASGSVAGSLSTVAGLNHFSITRVGN